MGDLPGEKMRTIALSGPLCAGKYPLGCLSMQENMMKCLPGCISSGEHVMQCPLGFYVQGNEMKCHLDVLIYQKTCPLGCIYRHIQRAMPSRCPLPKVHFVKTSFLPKGIPPFRQPVSAPADAKLLLQLFH